MYKILTNMKPVKIDPKDDRLVKKDKFTKIKSIVLK